MSILKDGIGTIITFTLGPFPPLYGEVELTPPGFNMGGPIDMTGLRTTGWVPQAPKSLKAGQPANVKVMFDPALVPAVWQVAGKNQTISIRWPTGATLNWWGWIEELSFEPHQTGQRPLASMVLQPSNLDLSCVATPPWWTAGSDLLCA